MRRGYRISSVLFSAGCVLILLQATLSAAQEDPKVAAAARLFEEGRAFMTQQEYASACRKFEESELLDPQLGTQLHIANCYERQGKTASAWLKFRAAAQLASERNKAGKPEPREQVARKRIATLEARLSTVRVTVEDPSAAELRVECNERALERTAWGVAKPMDPGTYVITARAPGRQSWSRTLELRGDGQHLETAVPVLEPIVAPVTVAAVTAAPAEPKLEPLALDLDTAAATNGTDWFRIGGYAATGLGVVAVAAAVVSGLDVENKNDELAKLCTAGDGDDCADSAELGRFNEVKDAGRSSQTRQLVLYVAGGALLAGGITLFVLSAQTESGASVALQVGPHRSGLSLQGTFY